MFGKDGVLELPALTLAHGQGRSLDLDVALGPVPLGGESYVPCGGGARARLDISRTSGGYALRLRLDPVLEGPCVRCLGPAVLVLPLDLREVNETSIDDEELKSPYVDVEERLDVGAWANDAVVLALPAKPICRPDCRGLCPVCGESLNDAPAEGHEHPKAPDPRFAKLRDLKLDP